MAYRNDAMERARLRKLWIIEQDLPCAECGSKVSREIAHGIPYHQGGQCNGDNCRVLCRQCNLDENKQPKCIIGGKVRLSSRAPERLDFTDYERARPRTIIATRYDQTKQCTWYKLGSNGKGKMQDGQPLEGYDYWFRSYMLIPYEPRRYHFKRRYTRKATRLNSADSARLA